MVFSDFTEPYKTFVQKTIKIVFILFLGIFVSSCKKAPTEVSNHQEGEMTIFADPSNKELLEALTDIYTMKYPKTKFYIVYKSEGQILKDLIDTVAMAAFINKPLTDQQTKYIQQLTDVTPRSTLLAYDAVLFVTSLENPKESISMDEIRNGILEGQNKVIFDDGNSGNYNTVRDVLKLQLGKEDKILALDNAQSVIDFIQKSPQTVGVIGMNEISEKDNPEVKEILTKIKVLKVLDEKNIAQEASVSNILAMNYPFYKGVYFIVREPNFGLGNGFSRFAGSNQGQLIVKRAGLQPNFLYDREVQINMQSVE
jgi:phosphate transport system substrate-binding protein